MADKVALTDQLLRMGFTLGAYLCLWRAFLSFAYPTLSNACWQKIIAPMVFSKNPKFTQSKQVGLPSYYSVNDHPQAVRWFFVPDVGAIVDGFKDGLILGFIAILLSPEVSKFVLIVILIILLIYWVYRITVSENHQITDNIFLMINNLLVYLGALVILNLVL